MSHNGHSYFKNLAACVSDHLGTLCIKGLILSKQINQVLSKEILVLISFCKQ